MARVELTRQAARHIRAASSASPRAGTQRPDRGFGQNNTQASNGAWEASQLCEFCIQSPIQSLRAARSLFDLLDYHVGSVTALEQ
jgi:hypothetical protein